MKCFEKDCNGNLEKSDKIVLIDDIRLENGLSIWSCEECGEQFFIGKPPKGTYYEL